LEALVQKNSNISLSLKQVYNDEYRAFPYPLYHRLRELDPVYWDPELQAWVLTGYNDVVTTLRSPKVSAQRFEIEKEWLPEAFYRQVEPSLRAIARQMLFLDPPDHTRIRGLVAKAFTPRMIERMREHIQQIVDTLLDDVLAKERFNFVEEFTYPLPAIVIAEMLGVPSEDREQFIRWSGDFGTLLEGADLDLEQGMRALYGVQEFIDYFRKMIAQRQLQPRDDLLQALIHAHEGGDKLDEYELLGNCILLLAAGHGTTTELLGNGLYALLTHPDQYMLFQQNPEIASTAVMELLRYDGPVQSTSREVKEDIEIGGKRIQAGSTVVLCLGAASHDPAHFTNPDQLVLDRKENRHLAFGQGIHFCLGAPLARLESEIAFSTLMRRLRNPRLVQEPEWWSGLIFRGMGSLLIEHDV